MRGHSIIFLALMVLSAVTPWGQACTSDNLIDTAWRALPPEHRFPCDNDHILVVANYKVALERYPELRLSSSITGRIRSAYAFVLLGKWPIYISAEYQRRLCADMPCDAPWMPYAIACILAHEHVHATGEMRESSALWEELQVAKKYHDAGLLPADFKLSRLESQYRDALRAEGSVSTSFSKLHEWQ